MAESAADQQIESQSARGGHGWLGVGLAAAAAVFILWLAGTGTLGLYIHPRYVVFTVVMMVVALGLAAGAVLLPGDEHGHRHAPAPGAVEPEMTIAGVQPARRSRPSRPWSVVRWTGAVAVIAVLACAMPTSLSQRTAVQRVVNASVASSGTALVQQLADPGSAGGGAAATASFTLRDWASAVLTRTDPQYYDGVSTTLSGFVMPDPTDPQNRFVITRFVITCCALDAQPVGVPVWQPGWQDSFAVDSWVEGTGGFEASPGAQRQIAFAPTNLHSIEEPRDPYLS